MLALWEQFSKVSDNTIDGIYSVKIYKYPVGVFQISLFYLWIYTLMTNVIIHVVLISKYPVECDNAFCKFMEWIWR